MRRRGVSWRGLRLLLGLDDGGAYPCSLAPIVSLSQAGDGEKEQRMSDMSAEEVKECAFFHDRSFPRLDTSGKSLLLFFDGIAMMTTVTELEDREHDSIALPLQEQEALYLLRPERLIDETIAGALADLVAEAIERGDLQALSEPALYTFLLHRFRVGSYLAPDTARALVEKLQAYGLVGSPLTELTIQVQQDVGDFIHLALPHLLRERAESLGLSLFPIESDYLKSFPGPTQSPTLWMLRKAAATNLGNLVMIDLEDVVPDLSTVPLDEILDFRRTHGKAFRTYSRNLRSFALELSLMTPDVQIQAIALRREEIRDTAEDLKALARSSWKLPLVSFGLGAAGASFAFSQGNLPGAGISLASALLGLKRRSEPATAFTYLYDARKGLGR